MSAILTLIAFYGTRALGIAQGSIAVLAGGGYIPENQLKFWMGALALLTYWRGQATSKYLPPGEPNAKVPVDSNPPKP